ncbi:MAG: putative lipopolysaccharide heptosyltransferase III [Magnetococcales bacterium]|nr:putative lipopolysaccharide heptosyltransferase III [Magnetococcales bacterium]
MNHDSAHNVAGKQDAPRRILIIKFKHIGDVLLATPLVQVLHENYPQATLSFLVIGATGEVLAGNPMIQKVWCYERGGGLLPLLKLYLWLFRSRFDLVIDLSGGGDRGAICTWVTQARDRFGHLLTRVPWQRNLTNRLAYNRMQPEPGHDVHTVLRDLELVAPLNLHFTGLHVTLPVLDLPRQTVANLLAQEGVDDAIPLCVVHATSRWMFKCPPPGVMAKVVDAISLKWGLRVVLTCAAIAVEKNYCAQVLRETQTTPLFLGGRLNLQEMAALLQRAHLYVGVDTAPSHMAAALNRPSMVIFGPTKPHLWGPWPNGNRQQPYPRSGGSCQAGRQRVCRLDWECIPCDRDGCEGSKISRCLTEMTPEFIMDNLSGLFTLRQDTPCAVSAEKFR